MKNGKIIDNFNCYIATILNSEIAKNSELGDNIKLTLSSGDELDAKIAYISQEENNKTLLVLELKTLPDELIQYRKISFNITWWSVSGLKVPNTSILEDENGLKYVVRKKSEEKQKVIVKVLKKNEKYSIINAYNIEELKALNMTPFYYIQTKKILQIYYKNFKNKLHFIKSLDF